MFWRAAAKVKRSRGAPRANAANNTGDMLPGTMRGPWKIVAVALFTGTLLFGGLFGNRLFALTDQARSLLRVYTELVQVAHDSYGVEVTYKDLVQASIHGMLRTLDPHTSFLHREAYGQMRERQQSSFHGLGILVGMRNGRLTVVTPIEGTPAWRMGLRAGDVIASVDGESTEGMDINEAVRKLKGPKGTQVTITIVRFGLDEPLEMTITRDEIPQNTVRYADMITDDTGFVSLSDFNRGTGREMSEAVEELRERGMERLVIDLRGNGGGLLDQAIAVADLFLPEGAKIVETRGRTSDSYQRYAATDSGPDLNLPLVILVGEGTASAAEILSGAVQDHDMGLIVGTPTWGKGLVQTVYTLSYDSGLALTTAKYYTPSGRLIQRDYSSWFDYTTLANGGETIADHGAGVEVFRTDLGREVYGGGGITPDVRVEPMELEPAVQYLLSRNAFFDFAIEYASGHDITDRDWTPPDETFTQFKRWVEEQDLSERDEVREGLEDPQTTATILRYIHAEIFNSAFGMDARWRVLAGGDRQIQTALEQLDQASSLLARRLSLYEAERSASLEAGETDAASSAAAR